MATYADTDVESEDDTLSQTDRVKDSDHGSRLEQRSDTVLVCTI